MSDYQLPKKYECISKSFRTGRLELSATRCSCIVILWVSLLGLAALTLRVASQRVYIVVSTYFVIDSVRKLLNTPSYCVPGIWLYVRVLTFYYTW